MRGRYAASTSPTNTDRQTRLPSRSDQFTFTPSKLKEVTDEHIHAEARRKYDDISMPQNKYE